MMTLLIIVLLIVGIFFLHRKLTEDKTKLIKNSKIVERLGTMLIVFGTISLYLTIFLATSEPELTKYIAGLITALVFIVPGLRVLYGAHRMRNRGIRYRQYSQALDIRK